MNTPLKLTAADHDLAEQFAGRAPFPPAANDEDGRVCEVADLSAYLTFKAPVFQHSNWRASAARIEADYADATVFGDDELFALMFLSPNKTVVMACRDELKTRFMESLQ